MLEKKPHREYRCLGLDHISVSGLGSTGLAPPICTEKDYYEIEKETDDSPRERILEVQRAQVHKSMIASPFPFSRGEKWLLRDVSCLAQSHTASRWKSRDKVQGLKTLSLRCFSLH